MTSLLRRSNVIVNENELWQSGSIVWALFSNQWWPSIIITISSLVIQDRRSYVVYWFGDRLLSRVFSSNILPFNLNYKIVYDSVVKRKAWLRAVNETIYEILGRTDIKKNGLHKWAYSNIYTISLPPPALPHWVKNDLRIHHEGFKHLTDVNVEDFLASTTNFPNISRRELSIEQQRVLKRCKTKDDGLYGYCLSCYAASVDEEHPFFMGHLCTSCLEDLKSVIECQKTLPSLTYCIVCADTINELVICSNDKCTKCFCKKCINCVSGSITVEDLINHKHYICFFCTDEVNKTVVGMLTPRFDFKNKVKNLFRSDELPLVYPPVLTKPLIVLSIDDAYLIGLKALNDLKIPVQGYYVINGFNSVSNDKRVKDLGNLKDLTPSALKELGPIDLLIIGSPSTCDLENIRIGGLHEFFRVLNLIKELCSEKFFWFFETVAWVDISFKIMTDRFLQCKPIKVNSPEGRLFWGNLPTLFEMEKYKDFCDAYASTSRSVSKSSSEGTSESHNEDEERHLRTEQLLMRNTQWNLEFFKKLLGFLSNFYHK